MQQPLDNALPVFNTTQQQPNVSTYAQILHGTNSQVPQQSTALQQTEYNNSNFIYFLQNIVTSQQQTINHMSAEIKRLNDKIDTLTELLQQKFT